MNTKTIGALFVTAVTLLGALAGPLTGTAHAQTRRQTDKNNMRNLGLGLGGAAVYEGVKGKGTNALILGAGAALAGKKYEDQRKAENKSTRRHHYAKSHYRHHRS